MSYIAPNSTIKILRNVPLEKDYINTLYFANATAQQTYFNSTVKYTLSAQSYQRANKGVCRVNYKVEDLYDCNYLMFQNTSFGTKWFYAFITSVDYVNNVTADIHYEIDVMQTWAFEMSLTRCFVEREHSETDVIGDNIVAEPVDTGEFVFNDYDKMTEDLDKLGIMIAIADADVGPTDSNLVNGIYSGAKFRVFPCTAAGAAGISSFLDYYTQKPDAVLAIYIVPYVALFHEPNDSGYWLNENEGESATYVHNYSPERLEPETAERLKYKLPTNATLDGYTPRNKKLYTYPYNFFHVDNANGRELNLRYEFFLSDTGDRNYTPRFLLSANPLMPVTCVLRPHNYKGISALNDGSGTTTSDQTCCSESIDLTGYPMCAWNVDSWNAWVAQNSVPESISILNKGADIASNAIGASMASQLITGSKAITAATKASVAGGAAGVAIGVGALSLVTSIINQRYQASIRADVCKGSLNNSNPNVSSHVKKQNFFCGRMSVTNGIARIIDDFFDRFGYATNRVKIPNTHSRPHWNYVKTIGSNVGGSIPCDDKKIIDDIFNNGITFWKNASEVDNYSLNNAPT